MLWNVMNAGTSDGNGHLYDEMRGCKGDVEKMLERLEVLKSPFCKITKSLKGQPRPKLLPQGRGRFLVNFMSVESRPRRLPHFHY